MNHEMANWPKIIYDAAYMIAFLQIRVELRYKRSLDKNFSIISAFSKGNQNGCTSMIFVIIIFNHLLN